MLACVTSTAYITTKNYVCVNNFWTLERQRVNVLYESFRVSPLLFSHVPVGRETQRIATCFFVYFSPTLAHSLSLSLPL